jgi:hypothetical protein
MRRVDAPDDKIMPRRPPPPPPSWVVDYVPPAELRNAALKITAKVEETLATVEADESPS